MSNLLEVSQRATFWPRSCAIRGSDLLAILALIMVLLSGRKIGATLVLYPDEISPPVPRKGTLFLTVDQPWAKLVIDEQDLLINGEDTSRPVTVQLEPGQHRLQVAKLGYKTFTESFTIRVDPVTEIKVHLEPLPSTLGTVVVQIDQAGAEVLVDGQREAVTTEKARSVKVVRKEGAYELTIKKRAFDVVTQRLNIKPGMTQTVKFTLKPSKNAPGKSPARTEKFRFLSEKQIKEDWDIKADRWRLEDHGIKLGGSLRSHHTYVGDIKVLIRYKGSLSIAVFGESFESSLNQGLSIGTLIRKKDTMSFQPSASAVPTVVTLKEQQLDSAMPIVIGSNKHFQTDVLIYTVDVTGTIQPKNEKLMQR